MQGHHLNEAIVARVEAMRDFVLKQSMFGLLASRHFQVMEQLNTGLNPPQQVSKSGTAHLLKEVVSDVSSNG
jgi:hypothetical protein